MTGYSRAGYVHSSLVDPQTTVPSCIGLPFAVGEAWTASGTHAWDGVSSTHRGHIDLWGASGIVRAAGPGTVHFTTCGLLMIDHGAGRWTSYYHINIASGIVEGTPVVRGQRLGTIGTNLPCGGTVTGAHVHFGIWQIPVGTSVQGTPKGQPLAAWERGLNGVDIGGWIVTENPTNYWATYTNVSSGVVQQALTGVATLTNEGRLA